MSLDVYLYSKDEVEETCICEGCGNEHIYKYKPMLFQANITHNLCAMATAAGIYYCLWHPNGNGIHTAKQLIEPLESGLELLRANPRDWLIYESGNGWGTYCGFVSFVSDYLEACKEFPDAEIKVSR